MANGEKWRILTPIILSFLTVLVTISIVILTSVNNRVICIDNKLGQHIENPELHYTLKTKVDWLWGKVEAADK